MIQRLEYLIASTRKTLAGQGFECPSCGSSDAALVQRKYLVTALRRCRHCELQFRTPTTSVAENEAFYQEDYTQGFTTDCPSEAELARLLETQFHGSVRDYGPYVDLLRAAGVATGARLFEFGCSWGYGSWQFARAGFEVEAFEISRPRARYARERLGVKAHTDAVGVAGPFDVFFTSHVLEHVPSVSAAVEFARRVLKPGGLMVAITPNGSASLRERDQKSWNRLWGLVHPNFLDERFYRRLHGEDRCLILSNPFDLEAVRRWSSSAGAAQHAGALDGDELLCMAWLGTAR